MSNASVTYDTILAPDYIVTGVRRDQGEGHPVILTGSHPLTSGKATQAMLYRGPLQPTDSSGYSYFTPVFAGQTVTDSVFYGPNTALFNRDIGAGNVRAVGSYKYSAGGKGDHGMMYEGPFDGSGEWTAIDMPDAIAGGTVFSTIMHSTMGDLTVGNYDLAGQPGSANAFIYDIRRNSYTTLAIGALTTAYGIWQNGGDGSSRYTIVGGCKSGEGINQGYLFDYDSANGAITHLTRYSYQGKPGLVTHFEGITAVKDGYALAATTDDGAALVTIPRSAEGGFGAAEWYPVAYPGSTKVSTGNTVIDDRLMGIFTAQSGGVQSYLATVGL